MLDNAKKPLKKLKFIPYIIYHHKTPKRTFGVFLICGKTSEYIRMPFI